MRGPRRHVVATVSAQTGCGGWVAGWGGSAYRTHCSRRVGAKTRLIHREDRSAGLFADT